MTALAWLIWAAFWLLAGLALGLAMMMEDP